jgi:hypothetical protein
MWDFPVLHADILILQSLTENILLLHCADVDIVNYYSERQQQRQKKMLHFIKINIPKTLSLIFQVTSN